MVIFNRRSEPASSDNHYAPLVSRRDRRGESDLLKAGSA
jgi:hypothetical protein